MRRATVFWANWGWLAGTFFILMAVSPSLLTEAQIQAQEQRAMASSRQRNAELKRAESERQSLIELSKQRLKSGCQTLILNGQAVTIRPGMRARDGVTGHPLAPGVCLSDAMGQTAVTDPEGYLVDVLPGPGMASGELKGVIPETEEMEDHNGYY